jgi:C4-dicarboxylate-specific signal transduction histidine kinase
MGTSWAVPDPLFAVGVVVFGLQAAAIIALLVERRLRRRAEAQNRAVLSSMAADLALVTRQGLIETCNDNWARAADTRNPFTTAKVGESWIQASGHPPQENLPDLHKIQDALDAVLSGREPERIIEYTWLANGQRKWSHLRVRRLERVEGGAVVAHVDITARKRTEGEVQRTLHELAHMNMRAGMGEIVSAVTHEVNQPLTASLGNAQALKRMLATGLVQQDLVSILDDIIDANRRAADVIGRIRTLMRKDEFDMRPIDFNAIVSDVVRVLNPSASNDGIVLVADLDPDLPRLPGDRVQLRQVVMNLVLNAVQATRGQAHLPPVVRVATAAQRGRVSLIVEDAGSGVGEDALPHLFEPYFTTKEEGLGVGLSISRSIVESHGGRIEVANLPKGGARFSVSLPAT